jgi:hypothetical protein
MATEQNKFVIVSLLTAIKQRKRIVVIQHQT